MKAQMRMQGFLISTADLYTKLDVHGNKDRLMQVSNLDYALWS